jgi:hypothetical protein
MQPGVVWSWIAVGTPSMMRALPLTDTHCGGPGGASQVNAVTWPVVSSSAVSTCQPAVFIRLPKGAEFLGGHRKVNRLQQRLGGRASLRVGRGRPMTERQESDVLQDPPKYNRRTIGNVGSAPVAE